MATKRMLPDTATLFNYIGEVNNVATYQETVLKKCRCIISPGATPGNNGKQPSDKGRLYIFDRDTTAVSKDGTVTRTYLPYNEWKEVEDKSKYWTISDKGMDMFQLDGYDTAKIIAFTHFKAGTKRMWHFEVIGR